MLKCKFGERTERHDGVKYIQVFLDTSLSYPYSYYIPEHHVKSIISADLSLDVNSEFVIEIGKANRLIEIGESADPTRCHKIYFGANSQSMCVKSYKDAKVAHVKYWLNGVMHVFKLSYVAAEPRHFDFNRVCDSALGIIRVVEGWDSTKITSFTIDT